MKLHGVFTKAAHDLTGALEERRREVLHGVFVCRNRELDRVEGGIYARDIERKREFMYGRDVQWEY